MNELMNLSYGGEFDRHGVIFPNGAGVDEMVIHVHGANRKMREALCKRIIEQFNGATGVKPTPHIDSRVKDL